MPVGPHVGSGEECAKEGAAETTCDEVVGTLTPSPSAPLRWRR